jgi:hypothetical protein
MQLGSKHGQVMNLSYMNVEWLARVLILCLKINASEALKSSEHSKHTIAKNSYNVYKRPWDSKEWNKPDHLRD